jgi:hypothetical protein
MLARVTKHLGSLIKRRRRLLGVLPLHLGPSTLETFFLFLSLFLELPLLFFLLLLSQVKDFIYDCLTACCLHLLLQQLIKVLDINLRGLDCDGVIFHANKLLGLCVSCDLVFDVLHVSMVLNDVFLASFGDDLRVYRLHKRRVF